ncbi:MAG: phosphopantothenate synthase, partial [Azospira oryzae]
MNDSSTKSLLLGLTGGIAVYKAAELTRLLVQEGVSVQVVMTRAATRFVAPATFQALSGNPVYTDLWDPRVGNHMAHIELSRAVRAILVAPASADFLAKLAHGLADDLLSTLCLARECPLLVAPAMNRQMWANPATQRNVAQLAADGVEILGPASGDQACGETGPGRMLEPGELLEAALAMFQPKGLAGVRALVTAGP